ncbi:MAG TPA: hypothetical protein VIV11_29560 [Kofleriaceae bacterium]
MSTTDSVNLRPPGWLWRVAILLAAIACLGLTMCVRSEQKRAPEKPTIRSAPQQQQQAEPPPPPRQKPEYFPATKAPGDMYRR